MNEFVTLHETEESQFNITFKTLNVRNVLGQVHGEVRSDIRTFKKYYPIGK